MMSPLEAIKNDKGSEVGVIKSGKQADVVYRWPLMVLNKITVVEFQATMLGQNSNSRKMFKHDSFFLLQQIAFGRFLDAMSLNATRTGTIACLQQWVQ